VCIVVYLDLFYAGSTHLQEKLRNKNCGRKSVAEKVWQLKCDRKSVAKKSQQEKCGRKTAAEKVRQKNRGSGFTAAKLQQQNATRRKKRYGSHMCSVEFMNQVESFPCKYVGFPLGSL
jgi:hypothetical protein